MTPYEAMMSVQPSYVKYGAVSPQFSDVGKARQEWIQRDRWRDFALNEIGDQFRWYEAEISSRDIRIKELEEQIRKMK